MADTPISRWKEGGIGRHISFSGFVLLCVCFFLPQVQSCTTPFVPASKVFSEGSDQPRAALIMLVTLLLPFTVAFLASVIYLLRPALRSAKARRTLTAGLRKLALLVLLIGSIGLAIFFNIDDGYHSDDPAIESRMHADEAITMVCLSVMLVVAVVALIVAMRARPSLMAPVTIGCLGVCFAAYFLMMSLTGDPLYGIWVSVTASGLIAIGGLWEALAAPRPACAAPETAESEP